MDRGEQSELKKLSIWGIYYTSFGIIIRQYRIFTKIVLISVLPVSFILLSFLYILPYLHKSLSSDEWYYLTVDSMFFAVLISGHLLLTLLLSSAVSYTVASIHADKDVSFRKLMRSIPRVSKRLMITFMWILTAFSFYNLIWFGLLQFYGYLIKDYESSSSSSLFPRGIRDVADYVSILTYSGGVAAMAIAWQLGSVVSVFEDGVYGRSALAKSSALINGKLWTAIPCFCVSIWIGFFVPEIVVYSVMIPDGKGVRLAIGVIIAALWLLEVTGILVWLQVAQTVLYLVCKSYNGEEINKALLTNHLEGFIGGGDVVVPRAAAHQVQPVGISV